MTYLRSADVAIGNMIFGTYAGFRATIGGKLAIKKSRLFSKNSSDNSKSISSRASNFRSNGYVHLGNPYDDGLMKTIQQKFDEHINDDEFSEPWGVVDGDVYSRRLKREKVLDCIPELADLVSDEVQRINSEYYGAPMQVRDIIAYRNFHVPPEIVEGTESYNDHWHCDGTTIDHNKLFVCLNDVTDDHGPLHAVSIDDTKRIAQRELIFDRDTNGAPGGVVEEESEELIKLTGPMGTAMLGNTQLSLHRAGIPSEGYHRDLVQFYIAPATEPLPDDWTETPPGARSAKNLLRPFQY